MGLLDAFKQYWQDASPGGVLNPEIPKDTPVLGLIADPIGSIRSTLNKANAQADAHLKLLEAATADTKRTGKFSGTPAQQAYQNEQANWLLNTFGPLQTVWHGSPHKFDKFDASKIGTGEGAQAYGHGIYTAEAQDVGKGYQKATSKDRFITSDGYFDPSQLEHLNVRAATRKGDLDKAIEEARKYAAPDPDYPETAAKAARDLVKLEQLKSSGGMTPNEGYLYKVDLPDDAIAKMLDWDKPLSQQHPDVQKALAMLDRDTWHPSSDDYDAAELGQSIYQRLTNQGRDYAITAGQNAQTTLGASQAKAAEDLRAFGIPGIRYLDGGSRGTGAGTSNFVVFPGNEGLLTILERNGQPVNQAPGLLAPKFVYPQEQALLTAQKNAALPVEQGGLGLRPDNTPMERAKALGYDLPQFHETTANKLDGIAANGFNPRKAVAAASDTETPYGVFTKSNGSSIGLAKEGEVQLPLMVRPGSVDAFADRNSLVANVGATNPELKSLWRTIGMDEKARANQIDALGEQMTNRLRPTNESGLSNAEIWKKIDELADGNPELSRKAKELLTDEFLNRGVDTVAIFNDAGSMGRKVNTSISLNPANVRSRFAAFDPMRIHENDLLGRASPGLLGLLAGGTGAGVAGYNWLTDR